MSIAALLGLVDLSGTLVLDSNGKIVLLPEGAEMRPGDIELSPDNLVPDVELRETLFAQTGSQSSDEDTSNISTNDLDADAIIAQIEAGADPTQNEDQATAAGGSLSSSITDAATVEAINPQVLAATFFETLGLDRQDLTETQTNALLDIATNSAPVTLFEARNYDEESQDSDLGLTFPTDTDGDALTVTVTELPKLGQVTLADGTPISLGQTLTQEEFENLQFDAPQEYTFGEDAGQFTYSVDDGQGQPDSVQKGGVLLEINPINDIPVIDEVGQGTLVESGNLDDGQVVEGVNTASGSISASDNDTDAVLTYGVENDTNEYGQLRVDPETGDWVFTLDNSSSATQSLKEGDSINTTFEVTVTDDKGAVTTETLTLTINGTNDLPTFDAGGDAAGTVTEQGDGIGSDNLASGALSVTDVDADAILTFEIESEQNDFGSFSVDENGQWQFELDNEASVTQALSEGETETLNYTVSVTDEFGARSEQVVTITVIGTNDTPEIKDGRGTSGAVNEAGHRDDGTLFPGKVSDFGIIRAVDNDGTLSFTTTDKSDYGEFTINALTGEWRFTLDNNAAITQSLKEGETGEVVFNIKVADEAGAFVMQPVTIEIFGANDQPTISSSSDLDGTVIESGDNTEGTSFASGTLVGEDVDDDTTFTFFVEDGGSEYGQLVMKPNGEWTFEIDNDSAATQALNAGDSVDITYPVTIRDEFGAINSEALTITVVGTNDLPQIINGSSSALTEDSGTDALGYLVATDTLVISDKDADEETFNPGNAEPVGSTLGSLTIAADGTWTYSVDNSLAAVQALDVGDQLVEEFIVTSADGTAHTIAVTVNGTEDETFITGPTADTVKEDTDVDAGLLIAGDNLSLTITDNDAGENKFSTTVTSVVNDNGQLPLGILTITEDGDWSYQVSNALQELQSLGDGDTRVERFTVTSIDGSKTETIEVTIQGTNDLPLIGGNAVGSVTEDFEVQTGDLLKDNGQLTISDADTGEAKFQTVVTPVGSVLGTLTITETGAWNYEVDNTNPTVQGLGEGDSLTETFQVLSEDGTPQNIVITINGVNDVPTITSGDSVIAQEDVLVDGDGNIVATNTLVISDDDTGEEVFNAGTATPVGTTLGTLTIDAAGVWTYKVDNSLPQIQALDVGTSLTESFTVTSADGTEHQIDVTVNGTEDPTIISNYQPGAVTEDTAGILTDSGSLSIADLDAGEALFNTTVTKLNNGDGHSPLGNLTIDANGNWIYTVDNSLTGVQELGDGITRDEVFQVTSIDGSVSQTIVVTITGVDGAPSIVSGESGDVTEDAVVAPSDTLVATDKLVITDEDAGENVFDAGTATPVGTTLGSLTITADGTWTYTLDNTLSAVQALDDGDKVIEEFTVTSADGTEHTIAVTINGTEDETFITGPTTDTVKEDTDVDAGLLIAGDNLSLTITDNDAGENKFSTTVTSVANDNGQLPLGTLTITEDGDWSYQV
ncbi:VCBS domain-containing protein, partial [Vibrio wakamikoensis]|uniref:VCBS domain-containing protein n=1 Tax=Vibrio wakamikoensis TaxID=2910251 RepID=UPI003D20E5EC